MIFIDKKNCTKRKNYETYSTQNFAVKPEFSANALTACLQYCYLLLFSMLI